MKVSYFLTLVNLFASLIFLTAAEISSAQVCENIFLNDDIITNPLEKTYQVPFRRASIVEQEIFADRIDFVKFKATATTDTKSLLFRSKEFNPKKNWLRYTTDGVIVSPPPRLLDLLVRVPFSSKVGSYKIFDFFNIYISAENILYSEKPKQHYPLSKFKIEASKRIGKFVHRLVTTHNFMKGGYLTTKEVAKKYTSLKLGDSETELVMATHQSDQYGRGLLIDKNQVTKKALSETVEANYMYDISHEQLGISQDATIFQMDISPRKVEDPNSPLDITLFYYENLDKQGDPSELYKLTFSVSGKPDLSNDFKFDLEMGSQETLSGTEAIEYKRMTRAISN